MMVPYSGYEDHLYIVGKGEGLMLRPLRYLTEERQFTRFYKT